MNIIDHLSNGKQMQILVTILMNILLLSDVINYIYLYQFCFFTESFQNIVFMI